MDRPDLIWSSYPKEKKDKIKGIVLVVSWIVTIILFSLVMLYGIKNVY